MPLLEGTLRRKLGSELHFHHFQKKDWCCPMSKCKCYKEEGPKIVLEGKHPREEEHMGEKKDLNTSVGHQILGVKVYLVVSQRKGTFPKACIEWYVAQTLSQVRDLANAPKDKIINAKYFHILKQGAWPTCKGKDPNGLCQHLTIIHHRDTKMLRWREETIFREGCLCGGHSTRSGPRRPIFAACLWCFPAILSLC